MHTIEDYEEYFRERGLMMLEDQSTREDVRLWLEKFCNSCDQLAQRGDMVFVWSTARSASLLFLPEQHHRQLETLSELRFGLELLKIYRITSLIDN